MEQLYPLLRPYHPVTDFGSRLTRFIWHRGAIRRVGTVSIATFSAVVSSILILAGSAHWTVAIKKAEGINTFAVNVESAQIPLGIEVSAGIGLYLAWAAYACLVMSIIPYIIMSVPFSI